MTETFSFAFLENLDSELAFDEFAWPNLERGQVFVKIEALGICGSQIAEIEGRKGNAKYLPHLLGHEGAGRVLEVGPGVTKVSQGDRVTIHWRKGAGLETGHTTVRTTSGKEISGGPCTTFATASVVGENRLTKIGEVLPLHLAVLLGCGLSTGFGSVDKDVQMRLGDRVLVIGLGGVGLSVALAAKLKGAGAIWGLDSSEDRCQAATKVGVSISFVDIKSLREQAEQEDVEFDYIFEVTGSEFLRSQLTELLSPGGTLICIGQSDPINTISLGSERSAFGSQGTTIKFSQGGSFDPESDIENWSRLLVSREAELQQLATTFHGSLGLINDIIQKMKSQSFIGRSILVLRD